jgi:RimJ/RimL family protein N-acetyltransferase
MKNPFLIGKTIYLRAPEAGDEEMYAASENHPDPRRTLYYAIPNSQQQQWDKIQKAVHDPHTIIFTICRRVDDIPIGTTSLVRIDWIGRMGIFYLAIAGKENWSLGYGREITRMMIEYAFSTLNLNRIQLHVSTENEAAIKVYKDCGFIIEGTLRQAMFFDNHYIDFYVMGILREDWKGKEDSESAG